MLESLFGVPLDKKYLPSNLWLILGYTWLYGYWDIDNEFPTANIEFGKTWEYGLKYPVAQKQNAY